MKLIIKAKNEKGREALAQHWKESKKLSIKQKLIFKTAGYKHTFIDKDTIELEINNRHTSNPIFIDLIKQQIRDAFLLNGASTEDFEIEEVA